MKTPVGYLVNRKDGLYGERGIFYDYILAENGLFIEAEGPLMAARIPVSECEVRGLGQIEPKVVLRHGKVPEHIWELALNWMIMDSFKERYIAVVWDDRYSLRTPKQAATKETLADGTDEGHGSEAGVAYLNPDRVILDMHTHPKMEARFSSIDNRDDTGLKLYGVIGHCGAYHEITSDMSDEEVAGWAQNNQRAFRLRVGVYGYFHPVTWTDVFDGSPGHEMVDIVAEEMSVVPDECPISRDLLEEAFLDPGTPEALKEDIERELHSGNRG